MELNKVLNTLEVKDIKEDLQMPQIFKFGGYIISFWSNENKPTESVEANSNEIMQKWYEYFGEISYYC